MGTYERQIEEKSAMLKWPATMTAAHAAKFGIDGAYDSALSKAFKGIQDLKPRTAYALDELLTRILKMEEAFAPFRLRLDNPEQTKTWLEAFESGKLAVKIEQFETGLNTIQPFYVIFIGPQLFERVENERVIKTTDYTKCAAFKTPQSATAVQRLLEGMGEIMTRSTSITNVRRDPATIHDQISQFGFSE